MLDYETTCRAAFQNQRLRKLRHWLTLEGSSPLLSVGIVHFPPGIVLLVLSALAVVFTPYLVVTLWKLHHPAWITGLCVVVGLPFILQVILTGGVHGAAWLPPLTLFCFYAYCWVLRYRLDDWMEFPERMPAKSL